MNRMYTVGAAAGVTCSALAGAVVAEMKPEDSADARLAALAQQMEAIRAENRNSWLSGSQDEEVRALINEVRSDSATRTSLLADDATAGYVAGKGFLLGNSGGTFTMRISTQNQFRYVWNNRDGDNNSATDENLAGFELRRSKIGFEGTLFDKQLNYKILGAFSRSSGNFELEEATFDWVWEDGWAFRFGQFKPMFNREESNSSQRQQAVERSYVNEIINVGKTQGVEFRYVQDTWRLFFGFNDGMRVNLLGPAGENFNTAFNASTAQGQGGEWAATARVDFLGAGNYKQFDDFTSWSDDEFGWMLGAGAHWQMDEVGSNANNNELNVLEWTIDLAMEWGGPNLFAYVVGRHTDPAVDNGLTAATSALDQLGFVVQGGYNIDDKWEPFARYEWYDFDFNTPTGDDQFSALTVGFNYFWSASFKHNWKWTTDVVYCFDGVPADSTGLGMLADSASQDGQLVVRSQIQVAF